MLGAVALAAVVISLAQLQWYFFIPLFVALALEIAGNHSAARTAAIVTIVFWICYPCLWGMFATMAR
jgi:hypothetical protein